MTYLFHSPVKLYISCRILAAIFNSALCATRCSLWLYCESGDCMCRGLALMPGLGVLSASHDQTLRLWDVSGACLAEFIGHTAIVYAVAGCSQVKHVRLGHDLPGSFTAASSCASLQASAQATL